MNTLLISPTMLFASGAENGENLPFESVTQQVDSLVGDSPVTAMNTNSYNSSDFTKLPRIEFPNPFPNPASLRAARKRWGNLIVYLELLY